MIDSFSCFSNISFYKVEFMTTKLKVSVTIRFAISFPSAPTFTPSPLPTLHPQLGLLYLLRSEHNT